MPNDLGLNLLAQGEWRMSCKAVSLEIMRRAVGSWSVVNPLAQGEWRLICDAVRARMMRWE